MKYYPLLEEGLAEERKFYREELTRGDWSYLQDASALFLIHAYKHLFEMPPNGLEIFADAHDRTKYGQFYLNLGVGLELLLKAALLRKGTKINVNPEKTIGFAGIVENNFHVLFPLLSKTTSDELKNTLRLINLRRNNIAHCSKKSYDAYGHEHRVSYVTLYIYEESCSRSSPELIGLLLTSIRRSQVNAAFKPLRIKPRSLR